MSTVTTEAMNEAIARFMELKEGYQEWRKNHPAQVFMIDDEWVPIQNLKYHTSWDWLMPVVEKISKMPLLNHDNTPCTDPRDVCHPITFAMPTEDGKQVMFRFKGFSLHTADTLIEAAHMAVYEVAGYHHSQKP